MYIVMAKRLYTWNFVFHEEYPNYCIDAVRNHLLKLVTSAIFDLPDGYIRVPIVAYDYHSAVTKRDRFLKTLNSVTGKKYFFVQL